MKKKIVSWLLVLALAFTACGSYGYMATVDASAASKVNKHTYLIKVNKQRNVVTVYKKTDGKYKPFRAMLCSTGGGNTPSGTHYIGEKLRWHILMGPTWGQYCSRFSGPCLFHSVWYYHNHKKSTCTGYEYNLLGISRSHGCIRLSVMDAKWIYENCPTGTKVKIFRSPSTGPLGKPKGFKVRNGMVWDPTDPDPRNPDFRLRKPVIKILANGKKYKSLTKKISYKSKGKFRLLKDVKVRAKNINAYQDLTSQIKIYRIYKYSNKRQKWVRVKTRNYILRSSANSKYKIIYRVYDKYCCGASTATLVLKIGKKPTPPQPTPPQPTPPQPDPPQPDDDEDNGGEVNQPGGNTENEAVLENGTEPEEAEQMTE